MGPLYLFSSANPFFSHNDVVISRMEMRIWGGHSEASSRGSYPAHADYFEAPVGGYYSLGATRRARVSQTAEQ
eukprot:2559426-Prymnesium_polylepis.1